MRKQIYEVKRLISLISLRKKEKKKEGVERVLLANGKYLLMTHLVNENDCPD